MKLLIPALLMVITACSLEQKPEYDLIISNVNLIDGTGSAMQESVNIFIKNKLIHFISFDKINQKENIIDGSGKYLIPGLFDCHVHTNNYNEDFPRFIHYGITSVFFTGGSTCTNQYFEAMRNMGNQDSLPAPRVFHTSQHFTLEGRHPAKTYVSSNWKDGETIFYLKDTLQIEQLVAQVAQQPITGIKLTIEDGPDPPFVTRMPQAFINKVEQEANKHGLNVFAHVSDNKELSMALEAGISNILHFTGVDLDFEKDMELVNRIYQDSLSWVTTLMLDKGFMYPHFPEWLEEVKQEKIFAIEEIEQAQDPGIIKRTRGYMEFMKDYLQVDTITLQSVIEFQVQQIKKLNENGVNMVLGTDTGNDFIFPGYALHEEMQLLELGGMQPMDIIKMGTLQAAKMMKSDDSLGSIEVGKIADMILLDKNPLVSISNSFSINTVIKNGTIQKRLIK